MPFRQSYHLIIGAAPRRWGKAPKFEKLLTAGHSRRLTSDGEAVAQGSLAD